MSHLLRVVCVRMLEFVKSPPLPMKDHKGLFRNAKADIWDHLSDVLEQRHKCTDYDPIKNLDGVGWERNQIFKVTLVFIQRLC